VIRTRWRGFSSSLAPVSESGEPIINSPGSMRTRTMPVDGLVSSRDGITVFVVGTSAASRGEGATGWLADAGGAMGENASVFDDGSVPELAISAPPGLSGLARRKPRPMPRSPGTPPPRAADRAKRGPWRQQPPRATRYEAPSGPGGSSTGERL
jgi:hypothetical protein